MLLEISLSNTKPMVVGIKYCPPNQTNFKEIFNETSIAFKNSVKTYILGHFNINLWQNVHYIFQKRIY